MKNKKTVRIVSIAGCLIIFLGFVYFNRSQITQGLSPLSSSSIKKETTTQKKVGISQEYLPAPKGFTVAALFSIGTPDGGGGTQDLTLENETLLLLKHAVPGTSVYISMFSWNRPTIVEGLGDAVKRGVKVEVIRSNNDRGEAKDVYEKLTAAVGKDHLTVCETGCLGTHINHNKFALFEALDNGAKEVVVQSSANYTLSTLIRDNNMLIYGNATTLYNTYLSYWNDMKLKVKNPDYNRTVDTGNGVIVYFFPQAKGDKMVSILDSVRCVPGARILTAHSQFSGQRADVAKKLSELQAAGCEVGAIIDTSQIAFDGDQGKDTEGSSTEGGNNSYKPVVKILQEKGAKVYTNKHLHSKYILIDAPYNGSASNQKIVVTGSANLTIGSLRKDDEAINIVTNDDVYNAFFANWQDIKNRSILLTK